MPIPTLFLHSYQVEYENAQEGYSYDIVFPDDVVIPANTAIPVDFKIRIAMYSPNTGNRMYGMAIIPKDDIINTPLIYALGCASMTNSTGAVDVSVPVRNVSDDDYSVSAGTVLFTLVFKQYDPFNVRIVDLDHPFME